MRLGSGKRKTFFPTDPIYFQIKGKDVNFGCMNNRAGVWKIIFMLLFMVLQRNSMAQFIIAGSVSSGDTYTDVFPDSLLDAGPYHLSDHPGESIRLDTDSDGVDDIQVYTWGGGGLGGGGGACIVAPIIPNAEIISHWDT